MEELSIEEKAQRYDEAIKRARRYYDEYKTRDNILYIEDMEDMFPELKESDSEKIKKELIDFVKSRLAGFPQCEKFIAWLEKQGEQTEAQAENNLPSFDEAQGTIIVERQGEQKPMDSVKPKFKVGDWIIHNKNIELANSLMLVTSKNNNKYLCKDIDGQCSYNIEFIDKDYHLWSIQDAKDGDMLCSEQIILLFKKWEDSDWNFAIAYAGIDICGKLQITNGHWLISNKSKPATKEQRNLLFQKMKEAGYEWDAEKKELKKIKQNHNRSEEDKKILEIIISVLQVNFEPTERFTGYEEYMNVDLINWLKTLKERYTWKPSVEQMDALNFYLKNDVDNEGVFGCQLVKLYQDLKKLKEE